MPVLRNTKIRSKCCQTKTIVIYENVKLEIGYRVDLMVDNRIIVEIKSVESLADIHLAQILTYMKLSECKLGLLVNFNVKHLKDGIKRVIL